MSSPEPLNEYDLEPIKYCTKCFSLAVKYEESIDVEFCGDCGCTNIGETTVEEWERLYEKKYGKRYIQEERNIKQSPLFKLSVEKLKTRFYNLPQWKQVIHMLYPHFPGGLSKIDSIILLFDKISKDGKLDDLRLAMMKFIKN